jgi:hypothetical protein
MGRPLGSKNRPKTPDDAAKPKRSRKPKGAGPVTQTSMRAKPSAPPSDAPEADAPEDAGASAPLVRVPAPTGKKYKLDLPVPIDEHEVAVAADDMVKEIRKREFVLSERRETMAGFKETLVGIDERLQALADTVEKHTKLQPVDVCERLIVETSEIQVVRIDTGEIVKTRTADPVDVQAGLFPEEPPEEEPAEVAEAGYASDGAASIATTDDPEEADIVVDDDLLAAASHAVDTDVEMGDEDE